MRIPKFLLATIVLFNLSQSLFAQWQQASSGYGYYVDAPVAAGSGNSGFTQMWHDNAVIWKYGNLNGGLRFGSATNLNAGNWTERMRITDNGFVGIGTSTPRGMFDIWGGTIYVTGSDFAGTLVAGAQAGNAYLGCNSLTNGIAISPAGHAIFGNGVRIYSGGYDNNATYGDLRTNIGSGNTILSAPSNALFLNYDHGTGGVNFGDGQSNIVAKVEGNGGAWFNGNVGIGTTDPKGYKLAVNGNAIFTKVVVKNYNNWPDYVFNTNYRLRPLSEVEQYINEHHHLPEVASAEEVKNNGLDISENQAALLKKIEELTLYVIEQNKKIEALEAKMQSLEKKKK